MANTLKSWSMPSFQCEGIVWKSRHAVSIFWQSYWWSFINACMLQPQHLYFLVRSNETNQVWKLLLPQHNLEGYSKFPSNNWCKYLYIGLLTIFQIILLLIEVATSHKYGHWALCTRLSCLHLFQTLAKEFNTICQNYKNVLACNPIC